MVLPSGGASHELTRSTSKEISYVAYFVNSSKYKKEHESVFLCAFLVCHIYVYVYFARACACIQTYSSCIDTESVCSFFLLYLLRWFGTFLWSVKDSLIVLGAWEHLADDRTAVELHWSTFLRNRRRGGAFTLEISQIIFISVDW